MPFADKFRATMDLPFAGDTVEGFVVERIDVGHESTGPGRYVYPVSIVLRGAGGQAGVRRALKTLLRPPTTTFSGYGNPYELSFGRPEVEPLGDGGYAVTVEGAGVRVHLDNELRRFLAFMAAEGHLPSNAEGVNQESLVQIYLEKYQGEIKRKTDRCRRRLRKAEHGS
ncbi:MAG: hypothetical protein GX601_17805 [Anaerolineales bacterium]|nr:hypothetical protein [Anaerolineales bacterium]